VATVRRAAENKLRYIEMDNLAYTGGMFDDTDEAALPCSDKLALDTQQQAEAAATVAQYQHGSSLKAYVCHHCRLWHLSSM